MSFAAGLDGGTEQKFSLWYRKLPDSNFLLCDETADDPGYRNTTSIKLTGLDADTSYDIMVQAKNSFTGSDGNTSESGRINQATKRKCLDP